MLGRHALTDLDSLGLCTIGTKYFLSQIFIKVNIIVFLTQLNSDSTVRGPTSYVFVI